MNALTKLTKYFSCTQFSPVRVSSSSPGVETSCHKTGTDKFPRRRHRRLLRYVHHPSCQHRLNPVEQRPLHPDQRSPLRRSSATRRHLPTAGCDVAAVVAVDGFDEDYADVASSVAIGDRLGRTTMSGVDGAAAAAGWGDAGDGADSVMAGHLD